MSFPKDFIGNPGVGRPITPKYPGFPLKDCGNDILYDQFLNHKLASS